MNPLSGAISIKDNMTSVLRSIRKEQSSFRNDVQKTKAELQRTWAQKYQAKLDATAATKTISSLKKQMEPLRKKVVTAVAIKDAATEKVKSVGSKIKAIGKVVATPVVKIKDAVSAGISKIGGKLKSLAKSMVIPVTIAATAGAAALGASIKSGLELEDQQTSIQHFIGATNKNMSQSQVKAASDSYIEQLRNNANATPFETGDVISAGSRAVSISGGDTKSAMSMITLAEDMAAASGGTASLSDAIEALADAKMGEMERLKSFGFKVSAEDFEKKGFEGVQSDLQGFFGGAAEKMASTGSGLISTIKGKLKSNVADFGLKIVDKLKPVLQSVISMIDKAGPAMEIFGSMIADKLGSAIEFITGLVPTLITGFQTIKPTLDTIMAGFQAIMPQLTSFGGTLMAAIQQVATAAMPVISTIINTVQTVMPTVLPVLETVVSTISDVISAAAPIISGLVEGIGIVVSNLAPVFETIFAGIGDKVSSVCTFVSEHMGGLQDGLSTVMPVIQDILTTAWSVISPIIDVAISVFEVLFQVATDVFNGIASVISNVWDTIKPIVDGIADGLSWVADKVSGLFGFGGGGGGSPGKNATGTNNWKGGLTWVGERGPELVELPGGSRILPTKESVKFAGGVKNAAAARTSATMQAAPAGSSVPQAAAPVVQQNTVINNASGDSGTGIISGIVKGFSAIAGLFRRSPELNGMPEGNSSPVGTPIPTFSPSSPPVPGFSPGKSSSAEPERSLTVKISKIADQFIVRSEEDIDRIGEAIARKIVEVAGNMA